MIIVTLYDKSLLSSLETLKKNKKKSSLFEIRLDFFKKIDFSLVEQINQQYPILWTFRSQMEGGGGYFTIKERTLFLKKLILLKPKFLDLEEVRDRSLILELKEKSPQTKLILSYHNMTSFPKNCEERLLKMKKHAAWKYKIAVYTSQVTDALKMLLLVKKHSNFIGITIGEKMRWMRLISPVYKQPITYAALSTQRQGALGQFTIDELKRLRYESFNNLTKVLGIIGTPLSQSPGEKVYNAVFAQRKLNAIYLKFEIQPKEVDLFLKMIVELKFLGLSVTIPYKEKIASRLDLSNKMEACNTLKLEKRVLKCKNTDGEGTVKVLKKYGPLKGKKVLFVGTGGAAKGIAKALEPFGAQLIFTNRSQQKAKRLASQCGGLFRPFAELASLKKEDYDILIHTTSYGSATKSLIPSTALYASKVAVDLSLKGSKLLKDAAKKGCNCVDGNAIWIEQGFLQFKWWFKEHDASIIEQMKKALK